MDFGCDMVRCISLKHRTDKQKYTTDLLNKLGVNFEFFQAIENKKRTIKGCFDSHIKILNEAYDNGVQRLMIFEDDIEIENTNIRDIKKVNRFLDENKDWEIFYLGSVPNILEYNLQPIKSYKGIYKGHYLCTHAYIINRSGIERFKDTKWKEPKTSIDANVYNKHHRTYAIFPCFYKQRVIKNDNGNRSIAFIVIRKLIGKFMIWYALNINIKLTSLLPLIIIVILITGTVQKRNSRTLR